MSPFRHFLPTTLHSSAGLFEASWQRRCHGIAACQDGQINGAFKLERHGVFADARSVCRRQGVFAELAKRP